MNLSTIGVDISKDQIDAHRMADRTNRRFANDKAGHKALLKWLAQTPVERVVFEPTGPYHRAFERALASAGLPLVKINPRQARRFAEATGSLAKTDRLDAAMLARMGAVLEIAPRPGPSQALLELRELYSAREALVRDRTAAKNRAKILNFALLKRQNAQHLDQIEPYRRHRSGHPRLHQSRSRAGDQIRHPHQHPRRLRHHRLCFADRDAGTGNARGPTGRKPHRARANRPPIRPVDRRAFIRGGRASLRKALYMPALVATRFNPDMKAKYDQLIKAGKPAKLALTAIMRKLIVLANALLKARRGWTENPA